MSVYLFRQSPIFLSEVCIPELFFRDETRWDWRPLPEWWDCDKTTCFWKILEIIREIFWTRRDYSVPPGTVSSSTEFWDFSQKTFINSTTPDFSWLLPLILQISVPIWYCYRIRTEWFRKNLLNKTRRESIGGCWIWLISQYHSGKSWQAPKLKLSIFIWEAFGNSWMFPDLKQAGKKPILYAGTESGPLTSSSRMLGTGNFPDFFRKNLVPGKCHSVMQTYFCK